MGAIEAILEMLWPFRLARKFLVFLRLDGACICVCTGTSVLQGFRDHITFTI